MRYSAKYNVERQDVFVVLYRLVLAYLNFMDDRIVSNDKNIVDFLYLEQLYVDYFLSFCSSLENNL